MKIGGSVPLAAVDKSKKLTFMQSIKTLFTKSKGKKAFLEDFALAEQQTKVLQPSGKTVERMKEIKDLRKIIEESKQYRVDRKDYYLHEMAEPEKNNPSNFALASSPFKSPSPHSDSILMLDTPQAHPLAIESSNFSNTSSPGHKNPIHARLAATETQNKRRQSSFIDLMQQS